MWVLVGIPEHSGHEQACTTHNMTHRESLNQPHTVRHIKVKGQSGEWLIKWHSELLTVLRPKAWRRYKTPRGHRKTVEFHCFHLFLYLLPLFNISCFLYQTADRLVVWQTFLLLLEDFTVMWCKCLLLFQFTPSIYIIHFKQGIQNDTQLLRATIIIIIIIIFSKYIPASYV